MELKAILLIGGDPKFRPTPEQLTLSVTGAHSQELMAYWEPGYSPCEDKDCSCRRVIVGNGSTAEEAIADYLSQWDDRYGTEAT
jgi:hypothetical protein